MAGAWFVHGPVWLVRLVHGLYRPVPGTMVVWTIYTTVASVVLKTIYTMVVSVVPRHDGRVHNICLYTFDVMQLHYAVTPGYATVCILYPKHGNGKWKGDTKICRHHGTHFTGCRWGEAEAKLVPCVKIIRHQCHRCHGPLDAAH